jgi:hypothetical protein
VFSDSRNCKEGKASLTIKIRSLFIASLCFLLKEDTLFVVVRVEKSPHHKTERENRVHKYVVGVYMVHGKIRMYYCPSYLYVMYVPTTSLWRRGSCSVCTCFLERGSKDTHPAFSGIVFSGAIILQYP